MITTPICDFAAAYERSGALRLHMPGHKGAPFLGMEGRDLTEIDGADVLYDAQGIIRESEENARQLFGTGHTLYSTEGSSLCIRAMLYLAQLYARSTGRRPLIAAARNAHKVFMTAAALLDMDICWLYPAVPGSVVSCRLDPDAVETVLKEQQPAALYVTSPDYLGNLADIPALSRLCRRYGALLLVDNAHGAYLKFLPESKHPIDLGADLCCDSAHKTLPVLTGGAYLHIAKDAPAFLGGHAQNAMALFASTSPSYLILQSLDRANLYLSQTPPGVFSACGAALEKLCGELAAHGYGVLHGEPLKVTVMPKAIGWRGDELALHMQQNGFVPEFSDPDFLVLMFTPQITDGDIRRISACLCGVPVRTPLTDQPPVLAVPKRRMSPREAIMSLQERIPAAEARGRILASASVNCPPAVPIAVCGEELDESAVRCFQYYGIEYVTVVK